MQWIIDLLKDWVHNQGYLTHAYVNRGDPALIDFAVGDFTKNNLWHALDLSTIVPAGAVLVDFTVRVRATVVNNQFRLRKHGNVNETVRAIVSTQVANLHNFGDLTASCDSNRVVDYRATTLNWTNIDLSVKGWWF